MTLLERRIDVPYGNAYKDKSIHNQIPDDAVCKWVYSEGEPIIIQSPLFGQIAQPAGVISARGNLLIPDHCHDAVHQLMITDTYTRTGLWSARGSESEVHRVDFRLPLDQRRMFGLLPDSVTALSCVGKHIGQGLSRIETCLPTSDVMEVLDITADFFTDKNIRMAQPIAASRNVLYQEEIEGVGLDEFLGIIKRPGIREYLMIMTGDLHIDYQNYLDIYLSMLGFEKTGTFRHFKGQTPPEYTHRQRKNCITVIVDVALTDKSGRTVTTHTVATTQKGDSTANWRLHKRRTDMVRASIMGLTDEAAAHHLLYNELACVDPVLIANADSELYTGGYGNY